MKIDEILAAMPNLSREELAAIEALAHELDVKARKERMAKRDAEPWPPPRDPERDKLIEWIESQPDDDLREDLAHNHDHYLYGTPKRP